MATVLSRALKLPGKKSPDLGEYDPLTQADSDESEDDLVLNLQQKNGGVKNGKSPLGEVPEPDSDAEAVGAAKPNLSEVATEGYPSDPLGGLEQKATSSIMSYVRTSVFLLTLVISMILVLVCAFLIPCPPRDLHSTWSRHLGPQGGADLSPLELADVNGDGLRDVLLSFVTSRNGSAIGVSKPAAILVCLSGMNGSTLWSSPLPEEARDITCLDLMPGSMAETICLVTGTHKMFSAFNATSGKAIWTLNPNYLSNGTLAAPGVVLPDLDEDGVRDLVVLAIGELQIEEPEWEKRRSINLSELIDIYSDGVELLQMVKAPDSNSSNLLITTRQGLILLRGQNLTPSWTLSLQGLHSQPTSGYFTDDQTLDFLLQIQDGVGMKKMMVVDGDSGSITWSYSAPCHMKETPTTSAVTSDQKSVFLFWAEGMSAASPSSDVIPGTGPPSLHHLYLLHPAFPSILLDLANATGMVTASEVGINDLWKDAFYVTRTTGPSSEGHPAALVVSKLSLRWALMEGQVVQLEDTTPKIGRGELRRFLSRIKFVDPPHQI
ncbi:protein FAM234B isoform X1 [Mirounga angustirostris]|uniref:protein FAM234B isoform X1 n=1 Tax=Mirounga angustirostris TaxID=9716 RepID=UPI00313A8ADD